MNPLMKVREAAEVLGVSRSKMYELIQTKQVATVKIGGARRIEPVALESFVSAHRTR